MLQIGKAIFEWERYYILTYILSEKYELKRFSIFFSKQLYFKSRKNHLK